MALIYFGKFLAIITSKISSILFLLIFPLYIFWNFCNYPTFLGYSVPFLFVFSVFLFAFQFGKFLLTYLQTHWFLGCVQFTDKPIKGILHICYSVADFCHFLLILSLVSMSLLTLLTLSTCSCMVSTFSIKALSILIIVIKVSMW